MTGLAVAIAGALGALIRYGLNAWTAGRGRDVALATAGVNVAGALALGVAIGATTGRTELVIGAGLLGGLTTFSTWMADAHRQALHSRLRALRTIVGQVVAGLAAALLGLGFSGGLG